MLLLLVLLIDTPATSAPDATAAPAPSVAQTDAPQTPATVYLIGNSLTNDTRPDRLATRPDFHIDCGKSLPYIEAHPEMPCKRDSRLWPEALAAAEYEQLVMQSHYGATLEEEVATISRWMAMQPAAEIIIHTGWAKHEPFAEERGQTNTSGPMRHSSAWYAALLNRLRATHPDRTITRTRCADALWKIADEIAAGDAPFEQLDAIYRDAIHMELGPGRYLMHNLMRLALGQDPVTEWAEPIEPPVKTYLDEQITYWAAQPRE